MKILLLCLMAFTFGEPASAQKSGFKVVAYYSGSADQVDSFDFSGLTHVIHSFSHLNGNELDPGTDRNVAALQKLVSLKRNYPRLKVMMSLGGWGGCFTCSDVFSSSENRLAFAVSDRDTLKKYGADGIDLDWEYPGIEGPPGHPYKPEDKVNFTDLIRQLRKALGKKYIISFAAGGFDAYFEESVEWKKVKKEVDFVNLMSYDLVSGSSSKTGHLTPLYSTSGQLQSVDHGVKELKKMGMPGKKIIIGMAFYARGWVDVPDKNHGLYQSGQFKYFIPYSKMDSIKQNTDNVIYWDSTAKAPYIYNAKDREFLTFDNKRSVELKTRYAMDHKLGGVMFWELSLDKHKNGLLHEIISTESKE